jgi:hypothetical protein
VDCIGTGGSDPLNQNRFGRLRLQQTERLYLSWFGLGRLKQLGLFLVLHRRNRL